MPAPPMDDQDTRHAGAPARAANEVVRLSADEALLRLQVLSDISKALETSKQNVDDLAAKACDALVPAFADFCVIELFTNQGKPRTSAYRCDPASGLKAGPWSPGNVRANSPVLAYEGNETSGPVADARCRLQAESLIIAPICCRAAVAGQLVLATGPLRRAFRPSALSIGTEVAARLSSALERYELHQEMDAVSRRQSRAARRLRRLASASAKLSGATAPQEVLSTACAEARALQGARGAIARWWGSDGTVVEGRSGDVDPAMAEEAFAATSHTITRGRGWVGYPLLPNDVKRRAALVVFSEKSAPGDEELVLASLASLVPVAFERAVGTRAALLQQARLRTVVSASPVALVGLGRAGEVTLANPAAHRLFGWQDANAVALPPVLQPALVELANGVRRTGEVATTVVSEGTYELSLSAAPMPTAMTGLDDELSVLVVATDLSEVKRAERALVQAQRLEAMGLLAGRVAHDFNNLLTVILGYVDILGRDESANTQRWAAVNIGRSARRAASLTQQLLSLSGNRQETGKVVDFAAELSEMEPVLGRLAGDGVKVQVEYPSGPVPVGLSPSGAQQVLLNLALNSCQAMEGTGGSLVIKVASGVVDAGVGLGEAEAPGPRPAQAEPAQAEPAQAEPAQAEHGEGDGQAGQWAVLSVSDNGPGMKDDVKARCLEPFFTTKQRWKGTGLGLSTVHSLVGEAGGHLDIDSAPGMGTTITVWLPVVAGLAEEGEVEEPPAWHAGKVLSGHALVVGGEQEVREVAARALEEAGLLVTQAADSEAGLEAAEAEAPFDILVTDGLLSGAAGPVGVFGATGSREDVPVLLLTDNGGGAAALPAAGPNVQVLHKPFRPEDLVLAAAALLGGGAAEEAGES